MSALGRTAYLDQSTIIKQGCSSQGSYCVNDLWMIDYPVGWAVGWAPGGRLLAKHSMLYYAILNCGTWGSSYLFIFILVCDCKIFQ